MAATVAFVAGLLALASSCSACLGMFTRLDVMLFAALAASTLYARLAIGGIVQGYSGRIPATFASLRYPNYRKWFVGQVLSLMGTWMQSVAQGWLVYQMTGSKFALGTIAFIGTLPTVFLMLPGGVVADRLPKRKLLIVTQTSMMVFAFALAALAWTGTLQVWQIGVLAFLLGVANSFDVPARLAIVPELVDDREDMHNAIALNAMMFNMARVIGPAIGGLVLAAAGAAWCFALNAASFLAVLIALLLLVLPKDVGHPSRRRVASDIREGYSFVAHHPVVRPIIILIGAAGLFGFSYAVLLPAYASDVLHVDEAGYGADERGRRRGSPDWLAPGGKPEPQKQSRRYPDHRQSALPFGLARAGLRSRLLRGAVPARSRGSGFRDPERSGEHPGAGYRTR